MSPSQPVAYRKSRLQRESPTERVAYRKSRPTERVAYRKSRPTERVAYRKSRPTVRVALQKEPAYRKSRPTERVASLNIFDERVCNGRLRLPYRSSDAAEDESCGLIRPLHHRDGRTLFDVHHMFLACASCLNCVDVRRERFSRERTNPFKNGSFSSFFFFSCVAFHLIKIL